MRIIWIQELCMGRDSSQSQVDAHIETNSFENVESARCARMGHAQGRREEHPGRLCGELGDPPGCGPAECHSLQT